MKKLLLLAVICLSTTIQAMAWGQMGHDVVAYIGEKNLSKKAAKAVREVLDGHSLVYYSSWMDNIRGMEEYKHTSTWHYRNIDEGKTIETMPLNEKGDVVTATEQMIAEIKGGKLSKKEEKEAVMMLIHLLGDMHCPMHAGRLSDLGGNRHPITFFGRQTNLHSLWDSALIESAHKWSYAGWWEQLDIIDKKAKEEIQSGEPIEWFVETVEEAAKIYDATPIDSKLSYDYITEFAPVAERQLLNGGLRLAKVLNDLYN
ncbi:MAG: S1/P1 nuclease [Rikenellaceae bacterium]